MHNDSKKEKKEKGNATHAHWIFILSISYRSYRTSKIENENENNDHHRPLKDDIRNNKITIHKVIDIIMYYQKCYLTR